MKLKNKKTGEIKELQNIMSDMIANHIVPTLIAIENEWEDYEEPKGYWYYDTTCGRVVKLNHNEDKEIDSSIGNCFETEEEAEKAVEKLKAWKRLKDTYHIRFVLDFVKNTINFTYRIDGTLHSVLDGEHTMFEDLKTIFGGE